ELEKHPPHLYDLRRELLQALEAQKKFSSTAQKKFPAINLKPKEVISMCASFPALFFLGTGASMPSQYRNVSGNIISLSSTLSIILDFGEGSLSQLYLMFSTWEEFCQFLYSIRLIFVSHRHADHHLGILSFLKLRASLFPQELPPTLIGPPALKGWFALVDSLVDKIPHRYLSSSNLACEGPCEFVFDALKIRLTLFKYVVTLFSCFHKLKKDNETFEAIRGVEHIEHAYGIKVENPLIGSIVYSGDSRPCETLIHHATNCTILIHEATFEDDLAEIAIQKGHSTIGEVPTQYSSKEASLKEENAEHAQPSGVSYDHIQNKTICAFDCMYIPLPVSPLLPRLYQVFPSIINTFFSH
ncbi:putative ribonuclease z, partial [Cardiosporidium cionae]